MILSRVSLRSICLYLSLWSDDADLGADVIGGSDLARPLHDARNTRFDLLFHFLGCDHVDRRALLDMRTGVYQKLGELGLRNGHRHPRNTNHEVSHARSPF